MERKGMKIIYTTRAVSVGGRAGHAETEDGQLKVNLVRPKELGGPGEGGTNPEQLFACGYAACFASTLEHVARGRSIRLESVEVHSEIGLGPRDEGGFGLAASIRVRLPGIERATARELVEAAHKTCPYSNAIRGNVEVDLDIID